MLCLFEPNAPSNSPVCNREPSFGSPQFFLTLTIEQRKPIYWRGQGSVQLVSDRPYQEVEQTQFLPNHTRAQIGHYSFGDSHCSGEKFCGRELHSEGHRRIPKKGMLEK